MHRTLFAHYRPSKSDFSKLWKECVFAFDANVLLDLYRYTPSTQQALFRVMERLSDRAWLTHQAAYEYHKNRLNVIADMRRPYDAIRKITDDVVKGGIDKLAALPTKHPFIKLEEFKNLFDEFAEQVHKLLDETAAKHPNILENPDRDDVRERITQLFDGKVGSAYPDKRLQEIHTEAKKRFDLKVPPGYMDLKDKGIPEAYGDVVLWMQLIEHCESEKKPLIFVTGDNKEDWWLKFSGKTIGPRPELREEFSGKSGQAFYMYETEQFMQFADEFTKTKTQKKVIDEVRNIRMKRHLRESFFAELEREVLAERAADAATPTGQFLKSALLSNLNEQPLPTTRMWDEIVNALSSETASGRRGASIKGGDCNPSDPVATGTSIRPY